MELPERLKPYFPSYELSDLDSRSDKRLIITKILNFGDTKAISWLFATYEAPEIIDVIQNPSRGSWTKIALHYWQLIFDLKLEKGRAARALMDATPRPEVYSSIFD
ncbi:MAG TPA: hypothetical protein VIH42_08685 [Thermoguttaceae bacterium]